MVRRTGVPRLLALLAAAAAAGCGGVESPDLAHGAVAGTIVGALPGGYAYPLGRPDLQVAVASDGRFYIDDVPAGSGSILLFDGPRTDGTRRAELVPIDVAGASVASIVRYGDAAPAGDTPMALAGAVAATAIPGGGAALASPSFAVQGTPLSAVAGGNAVAVSLGPLPAGTFQLSATMAGFATATVPAAVVPAATVGLAVPLDVAAGSAPGCAAAGGLCRNGLLCDDGTGDCEACLADADCAALGAGTVCDPASHFCAPAPTGTGAPVCSTCTLSAQCAPSGTQAGFCEIAAGAASGYCTLAVQATTEDCPAGFDRLTDASGTRCVYAAGCGEYFDAMGSGCWSDADCAAYTGLAAPHCLGADAAAAAPGYCTAACASDASCVVDGFTCDLTAGYCVRS